MCTFTSNEQGSNAQEYEYGHGISAHVAIENPAGIVDRKELHAPLSRAWGSEVRVLATYWSLTAVYV